MIEQTGTNAAWWSDEETAILRAGIAAGKSPREIAPDLPRRSLEAVKTRVRVHERKGHYVPGLRPMAGVAVRVKQLENTIAAVAASGRNPDEAYLKELRLGLIVLKWRAR